MIKQNSSVSAAVFYISATDNLTIKANQQKACEAAENVAKKQ